MADSPFFRNVELGRARLRVHSLEQNLAFYRDVLGFRVIANDGARAELSASGNAPALLILEEHHDASPRPVGSEGLFHLAFLYPDRRVLGTALRRLIDREYPLVGASDHGVSEALYLVDPAGNGLELYADRPPEAWPRTGSDVEMFTAPLALASLLASTESTNAEYAIPTDTRLGHVHLNVLDLHAAEHALSGKLAMPIRQRGYPGALFFGYDDYHHHVAVNRWGIDQPAKIGALGLSDFTISVRGLLARFVESQDAQLGGITISVVREAGD